jgi:hypothetical protein
MVLGWFGRSSGTVEEHISRKRYTQAIDLLRAELQKRRHDRRLRLQLGEVLVLAGRKKEAVELMTAVADDMALAGQAAQAIAVLKKVQALQPGRPDIEEKLAYMIDQRSRPVSDPWADSSKGVILPERPVEELGFDEIGLQGASAGLARAEASAPDAAPATRGALGEAPSRAASPGDVGLDDSATAADDTGPIRIPALDELPVSEDVMREELVSMIEETLLPGAPTGESATPAPVTVVETPLFRSFSRAELVALIRGLRLKSFEAGQIVVSEGEPGGSLFVVTSGKLRAFVKSPQGRNVEVRQIEEGEFFGEISVLSGAPRSATIAAAAPCDLLELDRATLDGIAASHPHVRQVLQEFYEQRKDNSLETLIRQMGAVAH